MSSNEQTSDETINTSLDGLAGMLVDELRAFMRGGAVDDRDVGTAAAVGAFLLAYRRDRDERAARGAK